MMNPARSPSSRHAQSLPSSPSRHAHSEQPPTDSFIISQHLQQQGVHQPYFVGLPTSQPINIYNQAAFMGGPTMYMPYMGQQSVQSAPPPGMMFNPMLSLATSAGGRGGGSQMMWPRPSPSDYSMQMMFHQARANQMMPPVMDTSSMFQPSSSSFGFTSVAPNVEASSSAEAEETASKRFRMATSPSASLTTKSTKPVKKRRSRQKKRLVPQMLAHRTSASSAENSEPRDVDNNRELDEAVRAECYGEKRMAIIFESYGSLGSCPQRLGNRNMFVPDGVRGSFSKYAEEWRFEVTHTRDLFACEDGRERALVTWTIVHLSSGESVSSTETPREAMTRDKLGRTICNKVFRDALERRKCEYEKVLQTEMERRDANQYKISNLEALIETLGNHRFAQGPLVFGLYHTELQLHMARQWKQLHPDKATPIVSLEPVAPDTSKKRTDSVGPDAQKEEGSISPSSSSGESSDNEDNPPS